MIEDKKAILEALKLIETYGPISLGGGICPNAILVLRREGASLRTRNRLHPLLRELALSWPKYSGNSTYPVPHRSKIPSMAYHSAAGFWFSTDGDDYHYSMDRWELLRHFITKLEKQIDG